MADDGDADLALLQEAGSPPGDLVHLVEYEDAVFWNRQLYDRWPLVVKLSDRITVEPYQQVPPISELGADAIGVSGIGTIAAAKVFPHDSDHEDFVAVSMYARWLKPHPSTRSSWSVGYSDASAHRIISDLSAFIGHANPARHRILAAGDLNMFYGATGKRLSLPDREGTDWNFWDRRFLTVGPQELRQTTCRPTRKMCRRTTSQETDRKRRRINWTTHSHRAGSTKGCRCGR